ncbi:NADPH-dependent F420 reductase [Mesorhizobium huakuii]|uniref:NAD(P)-binding domain-containing protein n=1 Tax=Mesorhizobium huakuii TaxID=28104 RepID=A0ABZ0VMA8_9HYPH|nr:NAD(P)-binding domain-containing protein [Mesorhizobium huakuii]WQB98511.1 NAD(P)-binding domain-containing protein [Mesorhizobium huakuii]
MRIGLLGAGRMAEALGTRFAETGHQIFVGARDGDKSSRFAQKIGESVAAGSLREAAEFGDILLLAVKRNAIADALRSSGADDGLLVGKVLIDCNNLGPDPEGTASIAEEISLLSKGARVVKAFNCCHFEVWKLSPPVFDGRPLSVPICGDDANAKAAVRELVASLGCRALDLGPLNKARHIEYLAAIVIGLLFSGFAPRTVFNLITETEF